MTMLTGFRGVAASIASARTRMAPSLASARRVVASLVLVSAALASIPDAHAQRTFARRFPVAAAQPLNVEGDITLIGNVNLSCPAGSTSTDDGATCASVQAGANGRNNGFTMTAVNVDADGTNTNSSVASLNLPAGSNVLFAGLYWGAVQGTAAARTTVRFKTPAGGYSTVTASVTDAIGSVYQSFADVTTQVRNAGNGAYTVGNIGQTAGANNWSGWTLVVAYQKTGAQLRNLSVFDGLQQGNGTNTQFDIAINGFYTPPSGVVNSNIGFVLYDGDRGQTDDAGGAASLLFGKDTANLSPVFDAINPVADFWNSSISFEGTNVTAGRTPGYVNLLGVDIDDVKPNTPLPNGSTTAVARFRASANDVNYPGVITLATDVFEPEIVTSFTKTSVNDNGSGQFHPGDTVTYTIALTNNGNDNSKNTVVSDPLPIGVTFVPGSLQVVSGANSGTKTDGTGDDQADYVAGTRTVTFRVGTGATSAAGGVVAPTEGTQLRFKVTIDPVANGASLSNVANVNYVSNTSGTPGSGSTPPSTFTITNSADVSITKTGPATATAGGPISYVVTVSNAAGGDKADGTKVSDAVPAGITAVTITCAASNGAVCPSTAGLTSLSALAIPTLPAGGSVAFTISGTAPMASGTLSNTASFTMPTGVVDPTPAGNPTPAVVTTVQAGADLALSKTLNTAGPFVVGQAVGYSIVVSNAGPLGATNVVVSDTPTNLTITSVSGAGCAALPCTIASIASGATATVTVNATITAAGAFDNSATVSANEADPNGTDNTDSTGNGGTATSVIVATNDTGTAVGNAGGTAVGNVLGNDTLDGSPTTTGTVTLSVVTPASNPNVALNTATGAVTAAAGTPAGTYTITYQICQATNPTNCATATITVTVTAAAITATNDSSPTVNGASGGPAIPNVLANDTLGGATATTSTVTLSVVTPASNPKVTLNTATGAVSVAAGTPAGTYTIDYRICEQLNPANCATATATVTVGAAPIAAANDASPTVNGANGGIAIPNVLANDTLNGATATTANVTLSVVTPASNPNVSLNTATGAVSVAPGTPAGTYTIGYRICEQLNPTNCATATATVTVGAAPIAAANDTSPTINGANGGSAIPNVLANDTLNGATATTSKVTLSVVTPASNPNVSLNTATGAVTVAPGTPAGTYTIGYRICEQLNPTNCATATATVTVGAAPITAANDASPTINGASGGPAIPNVLANDTLNGAAATTSNVTISVVTPASAAGVVLNTATGAVTVAAGTPAGTYTIGYRICEQLNPTNCATATATVTVSAAPITAANDAGSVANAGGTAVGNVLANDRLNGVPATTGTVTIAQISPSIPEVTLDPATGAFTVAPGTPAGTYTITYRICEKLNPTNCATATATATVVATPITAVDDTSPAINGAGGGTAIPSVLGNDTLGGSPATTGTVTISVVTPASNPNVVLDTATGAVTVAAGTPAGTYTIGYRICETANPTNCATATATVTVVATPIDARDDTGSIGTTGGTALPNVLANDTLNGAAATTANVTLAQVSTGNPGVTLDVATGAVNVATGTPAGTYTLTYRICETANPANCDTASVTVTVAASTIVATPDTGTVGPAGGTVVPDVRANDRIDGRVPGPGEVVLTQVATSNPGVTLNTTTGAVSVAPGTPPGTYTLTYRICETANPANCATTTVTVTVNASIIDARDDTGSAGGTAGGTVVNVLGNDTLGGAPATPATVTLTQLATSNPGITLDTSTGSVRVAAGTPGGTYTLTYRICETANPANCDTATVTVTVGPVIDARNDAGTTSVAGGIAIPNVRGNDTVDGTPALGANTTLRVLIASTQPGVTLDPSTGVVSVAPGTPPGTYVVVYALCDANDAANCDTATATVTVSASGIDARDDSGSVQPGTGGRAVANVLGNDTVGTAPATLATVTLTQVATSNPGVTLDPATGAVNVAAATPPGTYTLTYRICERLAPASCDTAIVTVTVLAPVLTAVDDAATTRQGTPVTIAVLGNDTRGGAPATRSGVTVTLVTPPAHGTAVVNADGTVTYTPTGTYSGTDTFTYRICDVVDTTACATATDTVTITPNTVDAIDQSVNSPQTGPVVINPIATTVNGGGAPLDPGSVQVTLPPTHGTAVVRTDGTILYTPDPRFFGTETFRYRICDRSTPTPVCDVATVTINVAMQAPQLRLTKTVPARTVKAGDLVRYTVLVENTGLAPAINATVVDTPPQGFTFVEGSLAVDDADDRFVLAGADPIRIAGVDVPAGGRATITYVLRIGAGVGRGSHTNQVTATDATGTRVSNTATADVTVAGDPTTDDTLVLGTVFLDTNGDGLQQAGEPGLPGVRIVSVEGLVIETDVHGRYHVAGIQAQNAMRGSDFVLKVDAASLPPGSRFTTSNPLVRRITPGIPVRFDFGVSSPAGDDATGTATR